MEMNLVVLLHRFSSFTIKFIYDNIDMSCSMDLFYVLDLLSVFSICRYGYGFWSEKVLEFAAVKVYGEWNAESQKTT